MDDIPCFDNLGVSSTMQNKWEIAHLRLQSPYPMMITDTPSIQVIQHTLVYEHLLLVLRVHGGKVAKLRDSRALLTARSTSRGELGTSLRTTSAGLWEDASTSLREVAAASHVLHARGHLHTHLASACTATHLL